MSWARYDDEFFAHRKIARLKAHRNGLAAIGLHLLANTWSRNQGQKGFVPEYAVVELAGRNGTALAFLLEEVGLFDRNLDGEPGWNIHDYAYYCDPADDGRSAAKKKADISAERSKAGSKGAAKRWQSKWQSNGVASDLLDGKRWQTDSPVPVPVVSHLSSSPELRNAPEDDEGPSVTEALLAEHVAALPGGCPARLRRSLAADIHEQLAEFSPEVVRKALALMRTDGIWTLSRAVLTAANPPTRKKTVNGTTHDRVATAVAIGDELRRQGR